MTREPWRPPARRAIAGARAIGQGLLGVALIALVAFVLLPSAHAAQAAAPLTLQEQALPTDARAGGAALTLDGKGLRAANVNPGEVVNLDDVPDAGRTMIVNGKPFGAPN